MSQIRIANKQDEPHIRALIKDALAGVELNLDGSDADLKNIEWSYFGQDGAFFVLEKDGALVGVAGATKLSDDAIEIKRLYVKPNSGLGNEEEALLEMLFDFARKMDYRLVHCTSSAAQFASAGLLESKEFKAEGDHLFVNMWGA